MRSMGIKHHYTSDALGRELDDVNGVHRTL